MDIGEVEVAKSGNRDIELQRIDAFAKDVFAAAALQNGAERRDERGIETARAPGFPQMACPMQILAVQQRDELGMGEKIVPCEADQPANALDRCHVEQRKLLFGASDPGVSSLEDGKKKAFLVAEIVVEHPLVGPGGSGNPVDLGAAQAVARKLRRRRVENGCAGAFRVTRRSIGLRGKLLSGHAPW